MNKPTLIQLFKAICTADKSAEETLADVMDAVGIPQDALSPGKLLEKVQSGEELPEIIEESLRKELEIRVVEQAL
jgi:hypothetical protein